MKYSTPPWKQIENADGDIIVKMDDAHDVYVANLEGSCEICHGNARLIELAPEIFEALKRARRMLGPHSLHPDAEGFAIIDSVIERIEGKL